MTNILESKGLEDYIDPTCVTPTPLGSLSAPKLSRESVSSSASLSTPTPTPDHAAQLTRLEEIKTWKTNNEFAKTTILINCNRELGNLIANIETAAGMWSVLRNQYEAQGLSLKMAYLDKLQQLDYREYKSMTSFIVAFKGLHSRLEDVNMKFPEEFYTITFLNVIESTFPILTDRWRYTARVRETPITLTELYYDVTDEARQQGLARNHSSVALYAKNPRQSNQSSRRGGRGGSKNGSSSNSDSVQTCGHCNKANHKDENCFTKFPEKLDAYRAMRK